MKYCPLCEKSYDPTVEVCAVDGAMLLPGESEREAFEGQVIKKRYRVLRRIGEGGMGSVYLAEQLSISRNVALKVLHKQFSRDEEFVRRFHQEARLAASLNHRSITTIFDFDQTEEGSLFIVMEYLQGRILSEVVRQDGTMSVGRVVRLGIEIAEGLEAAHAAGVIHRDVKSQNIMVVGSGHDVKLMDFGIARLRDGGASQLTQAGLMVGTPAYMAPEQIEGESVDERADIYALGIVLYEMLIGKVPFSGASPGAVLTKQLRERPIPPHQLRQDVPPALDQLVVRALEKDPRARQENMAKVVEELRRAQEPSGEDSGSETVRASRTVVSSAVDSSPAVVVPQTVVGDAAQQTIVADPRPARHGRAQMTWKPLAWIVSIVMLVAVTGSWFVLSDTGIRGGRSSSVASPPGSAVVQGTETTQSRARPIEGTEAGTQKVPEGTPPMPEPPKQMERKPTGSPAPKPRVDVSGQDPSRIRALVEEKLQAGGLLKTSPDKPGVAVEVSPERVVTLAGILRNREELAKSIRLAKQVPGVRDVRQKINLLESWDGSRTN